DFDRLAIVHRTIAVRHSVQVRHAIEHATRLDQALENIRQELFDVSARRCDSAGDGNVVEECRLCFRNELDLRNANASDCTASASDAQCCASRLFESNALENGMDTVAVGQLTNFFNRLVAALTDDVSRAKIFCKSDTIGMPSQHDDLFGAELARSNHAAETNRAVTD